MTSDGQPPPAIDTGFGVVSSPLPARQSLLPRPWGCPECGEAAGSQVIDSRPSPHGIRRRRLCLGCNGRYSTLEMVDPRPLLDLLRAERDRATELRDILDDFLATFPEDMGGG